MPGTTFRELVDEYLTDRKVAGRAKRGAAKNYLVFLRQGLEPLAEWGETTGVTPQTFGRPQLIAYIDSLRPRKSHNNDAKAEYAPSTQKAYTRLVRALMLYAEEQHYIEKAISLKGFKWQRTDPKALEPEDLPKVLAACRRKRDKAIVSLLADSGIRRAELCSLVWGDLAFEGGEGVVTVRHGKGDKDRESYFLSDTWELLQKYGKSRPQGKDDPVFLRSDDERPFSPPGLGGLLAAIGERAGIRLTPHMLRHYAGRHMAERGVPLNTIQQAFGHYDASLTINLYGKFSPKQTKRSYFEHMQRRG